MANKFSLTIKVDGDKVDQFTKQNYKFCFAAGVAPSDGGDPAYNIVASTYQVGREITVEWTERYAIGASNSTFNNGVKFVASTGDPVPISFGQSYTQTPTFNPGLVNNDKTAPPKGFKFINQAKAAAAIVYKWVDSKWAPIYISQAAPLGPGIETLIPKITVALWFSVDNETKNMISQFNAIPLFLDMTNNKSRTAVTSFSKDGEWTVESNQ